jgi:hypothetical protein
MVAPPVMVEKKDTKIYRMCIDFTALNKHFLKDYFPLPWIDLVIDSTAGCEQLSFLNTYSNNEAEYEAILHGMRMAKACGEMRIKSCMARREGMPRRTRRVPCNYWALTR